MHLAILRLLADKPRHGYEVIKELADLSGGSDAPDPATVYPALTYLEDLGLVSSTAGGGRKLYEITAGGRQHLQENGSIADELWVARHALKKALRETHAATVEEQQRIIGILQRAAAEIRAPAATA